MRRGSISNSHSQALQPPPKYSTVKEIVSQPPSEGIGTSKNPDSSKGSNRSDENHYASIKPPPRRKPNALPSGTHIQRRPISAHQYSNGSGQGPSSPQHSRAPRDRKNTGLSSPTTEGRRAEIARPLRFERRADPSPAPSRPSRANRRKLAPAGITVFHEVQPQRHAPLSGSTTSLTGGTPLKDKASKGNTASPVSTSTTTNILRRNGKETANPSVVRTAAPRLPSATVKVKEHSEKREVEERLQEYLSACEQDGESANAEWVAVIQKYLRESEDTVGSPDVSLRGFAPESPAGVYEYSSIGKILRPPDGGKGKSVYQAPKMSNPIKAPRRNLTGGMMPGNGASKAEEPHKSAAEAILEKMAVYCHQRHGAMRFKKDIILQKRQGVAAALESFRSTYQTLANMDDSFSLPSPSSPGKTKNKPPPSLQSTVTPSDSKVERMKANADRLTNSLHSMQQAVVQLLLRLQDYAREVRKPLGIATMSSDYEISKSPSLNMNLAIMNSTPALGNGERKECQEENFFTTFTEFVTQQEKEIAEQLREVQETVERTLAHSDLISVEDPGILQTPLFCRSTTSPSLQAHVNETPSRPLVSKPSAVIRLTTTSSSTPPKSTTKPYPPHSSSRARKESISSTRAPSPLFTVSMDPYGPSSSELRDPHGDKMRLVLGRAESSSPRNSAPPSVMESRGGGQRSVVQRKGRSSSVGQHSAQRRSQSASLRGSTGDHLERSQSSYRYGTSAPAPLSLLSKTQLEQAKSVWTAVSTLLAHESQGHSAGPEENRISSDRSSLEAIVPAGFGTSELLVATPSERERDVAVEATTFVVSPGNRRGKELHRIETPGAKKGANASASSTQEKTSGHPKAEVASPVITPPQGSHRDSTAATVPVTTVSKKSATPTTTVKPKAQHVSSSTLSGRGPAQVQRPAKEVSPSKQSTSSSGRTASDPTPVEVITTKKRTSEEERAATVISAYWRSFMARRKTKERQAHLSVAQVDRQSTQLRLVAAKRLQNFFLQLRCRRKIKQEVARASQENTYHKKSTVAGSQPVSVGSSRADSSHKNVRDRFLRAKEQRRALNASLSVESASDSSTLTTSASGRDRPASPTLVLAPVVTPLPLLDNGISTKDIMNYNRDSESFELQVIHRLLRAPPALVYFLAVLTMKNPHFPPMGYAAMRDKNTPTFDTLIEKVKSERNKRVVHIRPDRLPRHLRGLDGSVILPFSVVKKIQPPLFTFAVSVDNSPSSSPNPSVPWTPRYKSVVRPNELREPHPVIKDFKRPFERWGTANALVRRLFTAAAIYSWKLIFSHTPHDDYKQRQLQNPEEQAARLDRVDQRNRMILACYCVHSEREWLREASKDISFVGQIWNPKKSLDPNDPDLHRHCKETFEFVEDFLYQCFPTVSALEEIPSFLLGAGIFFLLRESLNYSEYIQASHVLPWGSAYVSKPIDHFPTPMNREKPLTGWSQAVQQRYELCDLLDRVVNQENSGHQGKLSKVMTSATLPKVDTASVGCHSAARSRGTSLEALFEKVASQSTPSTIFEASRLSRSSFTDGKENDDGVESTARIMLVGVPVTVSSVKYFFRDYEESLLGHISRWVRQRKGEGKPSLTENENEIRNYTILYPKKYLVTMSETIAKILFGLQIELEVCEELDCLD